MFASRYANVFTFSVLFSAIEKTFLPDQTEYSFPPNWMTCCKIQIFFSVLKFVVKAAFFKGLLK